MLTLTPEHDHHDPAHTRYLRIAGLQGAAVLAGYGTVSDETTRLLAGLQRDWDRISVHPETGVVLATDRYRPTADIIRHVRIRDRHCRAPGCTTPAERCDIDHTRPAARGGPTRTDNLTALCRRHHMNKHHTGMQMRLLEGGVVQWRTPLGSVVTDTPTSTVAFRPRHYYTDTSSGIGIGIGTGTDVQSF